MASATGGRVTAPSVRHVILDRDGVLNRELESGWLSEIEQWRWESGSLEALQVLARAGIELSIVSNQSGIGRGVVTREAVDRLHDWLAGELRAAGVVLAGVYLCPHAPDAGCRCRKPEPGLVTEAIEGSGIAAEHTMLIGDDSRDLEAGKAAGVETALVRTGKGSQVEGQIDSGTLVFENLLAAAAFIADRTPLSTIGSRAE